MRNARVDEAQAGIKIARNSITSDMQIHRTSLVAQTVKRLPTMQETWVQSLGWEDLLKKEMGTHSSILAWKIPWMEEPGRLQSMGSQRVRRDWVNSLTHADDTTLMAESKELKSLLMKMKEEWKSWLKTQHSKNEDHDIWSNHFMANRWGNSGNSDRFWAPKSLQMGWWLQPWN